jgi:AraC-like DNA-binding protein
MKQFTKNITGVVKHQTTKPNYTLRRYYPKPDLADLVEQFWFVNWDLPSEKPHTQVNLPDPNFHLVITNNTAKLLGPVSKSYSYTMKNKGSIISVKFKVGAMATVLSSFAHNYVDKTLNIDTIFKQINALDLNKLAYLSDDEAVETLNNSLLPHAINASKEQLKIASLIDVIKPSPTILKVEELAEHTAMSVRTLQRHFKKYIGLSPKWLIRKYRLHKVLEALEKESVTALDMVEALEYTDLSHLHKDVKEMLGITPKQLS